MEQSISKVTTWRFWPYCETFREQQVLESPVNFMFNVTLHLFFTIFQPLLVISFFSWMIFLVHIRFLFFFSSQMDDMGRCQILGSHCTHVVLFISKCVGNFLNQSDWQNIFLWERFSPIYLKDYCHWELGCFLHVLKNFNIWDFQ